MVTMRRVSLRSGRRVDGAGSDTGRDTVPTIPDSDRAKFFAGLVGRCVSLTADTRIRETGAGMPQGATMNTTESVAFKEDACPGPGVLGLPPMEPALAIEVLPIPELVARYRKGVENFDKRLFALDAEQLDLAFLPEAG